MLFASRCLAAHGEVKGRLRRIVEEWVHIHPEESDTRETEVFKS